MEAAHQQRQRHTDNKNQQCHEHLCHGKIRPSNQRTSTHALPYFGTVTVVLRDVELPYASQHVAVIV
jgi:hypothetical protein